MAIAGSGDVLTGIIDSLLSGYSPREAVIVGVYIHSLIGDYAVGQLSVTLLIT